MKSSKGLLLLSCFTISTINADGIEKLNVLKLGKYARIEITNENGSENIFYDAACNCDERDMEFVATMRFKPNAFLQDIFAAYQKVENSLLEDSPFLQALALAEAQQQADTFNDVLDKGEASLSAKDKNGKTAEDILKEKLENLDSKSEEEQIKLAPCMILTLAINDLKAALQQRAEERKNAELETELQKSIQ